MSLPPPPDFSRICVPGYDFEDIRERQQIYVDKTDLIYELTALNEPIYLSRPRRFGKSLLASTLHSLFAHGTTWFKSLKIEKMWHEAPCKGLHLDFTALGTASPPRLRPHLAAISGTMLQSCRAPLSG